MSCIRVHRTVAAAVVLIVLAAGCSAEGGGTELNAVATSVPSTVAEAPTSTASVGESEVEPGEIIDGDRSLIAGYPEVSPDPPVLDTSVSLAPNEVLVVPPTQPTRENENGGVGLNVC